jgi:hypothetical protein
VGLSQVPTGSKAGPSGVPVRSRWGLNGSQRGLGPILVRSQASAGRFSIKFL